MSGVFQNIGAGGVHTRRVERGVGGQYFQYFGRRQTQLCSLHM
jgi:hypothetical protein